MRLVIGRFMAAAALAALSFSPTLHAQEFKFFDRTVQVHGFGSQGYVKTDGNNWLTMNTSDDGSFHMTDVGLNLSSPLTDKLRAGAQVYDHNLGQLGQWHPSLDWAFLDFRAKQWLGFRGGKVKTTVGLFTDTQDLDFLRTFALLPQSVYPIDMRDANIAHSGGDVYGRVPLAQRMGKLDYTVWSGHRNDSMHGGYAYFLQYHGTVENSYGGLQYGGDVRWETPVKGLLLGISRLDEDLIGIGTRAGLPNVEKTKKDFTNQFFDQYIHKNLEIDSEFKRQYRDHILRNGTAEDQGNLHAWYVAGSYRLFKRVSAGGYYSHYTATSTFNKILDTDLPDGHVYDKAITGRVDINRFWNVKVEGHFMDGYALASFPEGLYPQQNQTFASTTNGLVMKTGFNF